MLLLASAVKWTELKDGVLNFFRDFGVLYCVEILLFFCVIFFVSKVLRDNDASKLMLVYWTAILAGGVMHVFDGEIMSKQLFLFYVILVSAVMVILFSVEVKKYLWDVHQTKERAPEKATGGSAEVR